MENIPHDNRQGGRESNPCRVKKKIGGLKNETNKH
jgi:hypothetical protein